MLAYLIRRLLGLVFVIIGLTFITYAMGYLSPTQDPIRAILGVHYTPQEYAFLRHQYGLDLPWYEQYLHYLGDLAHGSFGYSYYYQSQLVTSIIGPKIVVSLQLGLYAFVLSLIIGIPVGVLAALRRDTTTDTISMGVMLVMYALPVFVVVPFFAVAMVFLTQHGLPSLPTAEWESLTPTGDFVQDSLLYKIAPVTILAFTNMGYYARLTRTVMLEVLGQDYVRTARAKGLSERRVIYVHALRNAMLPLLSVIGPSLAFIVTGAFVIELLFNIPGIGFESVQAIPERDWPVVQATVVILAFAVVAMNFVTDILYSVVDPRIRIAEGG